MPASESNRNTLDCTSEIFPVSFAKLVPQGCPWPKLIVERKQATSAQPSCISFKFFFCIFPYFLIDSDCQEKRPTVFLRYCISQYKYGISFGSSIGKCTPGFWLLVSENFSPLDCAVYFKPDSQSKWSKVIWQVLSRASHVGMLLPPTAATASAETFLAWLLHILSNFPHSSCRHCFRKLFLLLLSLSPRTWECCCRRSRCLFKCVCDYLVMASNWVFCCCFYSRKPYLCVGVGVLELVCLCVWPLRPSKLSWLP